MSKIITGKEADEQMCKVGAKLKIVEIPEDSLCASGEPFAIPEMDMGGYFAIPEGTIIEVTRQSEPDEEIWTQYKCDGIPTEFCMEDDVKLEVV